MRESLCLDHYLATVLQTLSDGMLAFYFLNHLGRLIIAILQDDNVEIHQAQIEMKNNFT